MLLGLPSLSSCAKKGDAKAPQRHLRVCADPNNLPFSNQRLEGFENRIADLLARDMNPTVDYTWWAQRRGFILNTLKASDCDVVIGLPIGSLPKMFAWQLNNSGDDCLIYRAPLRVKPLDRE